MKRSSVVSLLILLLVIISCKKAEKQPDEIIALDSLPFGESALVLRDFFTKAGWKVQTETPEKVTFYFPAAVPEELRKLPVMGEHGTAAPEPYTMQIFFHEGKAVIAILHRFDQTERMKSFVDRLTRQYALPAFSMRESTEKTAAGNTISESKGAAETAAYVFVMMRSSVNPAEEKLKDGMNDEIELRIFPRKFNEGISARAMLQE